VQGQPLTGKKPVYMTNRLAFAHMLPRGGTLKFKALEGPAAVKKYMEGRSLEVFLTYDPMLAGAVGAPTPGDFGTWLASLVKSHLGVFPEPMQIPPALEGGVLYGEFDVVVDQRTIEIAGVEPQARLVAHWFEVTLEQDAPAEAKA